VAGETIRTKAICLSIAPWSKTSHVVTWLTPYGRLGTVVKGAVRPKSQFLGQYDLNYTCEILYYARPQGELHALRDCAPLERRDALREDYRALAFAGYCRLLTDRFAPAGNECQPWYDALEAVLDAQEATVAALVRFELRVLHLLGLEPEIEAESGAFVLRGERKIAVSEAVANFLKDPLAPIENLKIPLDAARVIGVFYQYHLDCPADVRRSVLGLISKIKESNDQK